MEINLSEIFAINAARSAREQERRIRSLDRARASAARQRAQAAPTPALPVPAETPADTHPTTRETDEPMRGEGLTVIGTRYDGSDILAKDITDHPETAYATLGGAATLTPTGTAILNILRKSQTDDGVIRNEHDYRAQLAAHRGLPPEPPLPAGYDGRITSESDYQALLRHHKWEQKNRR